MRTMHVLGAAVLLFALAACDTGSPTGPTTPPVDPTTRVFEGALGRNGAASHDFTPERGGSVIATLTRLDGPEGLEVGLGLGNWFGGVCSLTTANDRATLGSAISGQLQQGGPLCVRIYDADEQVPAGTRVDYVIEVVHP